MFPKKQRFWQSDIKQESSLISEKSHFCAEVFCKSLIGLFPNSGLYEYFLMEFFNAVTTVYLSHRNIFRLYLIYSFKALLILL